jgi:hypothetical protein
MAKEKIAAGWIRRLFEYDTDTGVLSWAMDAGRHGRIKAGTEAGYAHTDTDGYTYRYVVMDGRHYRTTHLIWAWMTGEWPQRTIDHKDQNTINDRWSNLREADNSQQKQNNRKRRDSKTGFKCIVRDKERGQYRWQVVVNGKRIKGRRFDTAEEAYADYQARLPGWHGDFANDGG